MRLNKFNALLAVVLTSLLTGCLSDGSSDPTVVVLPRLEIDYPRADVQYSTDGASMTVIGLAFSTASQARPDYVTLELGQGDDAQEVSSVTNGLSDNFLYWLMSTGDVLEAGVNVISASATASSGSFGRSRSVVRGTSYMAEKALGYDAASDRWFVLDAAKKALLVQTMPVLPDVIDATTPRNEKTVFDDENPAGALIEFERPIDFALDSARDRILLLDNGATPKVIAIALADGDRSELGAVAISNPVAIAIDEAGDTAYIAQRGDNAIVAIDLLTDTPAAVSPISPDPSIALQNPQDIVFQPAATGIPNRLIVADRRVRLEQRDVGTVASPSLVTVDEQDVLVTIDLDNGNAAALLLDNEECQSADFGIVDCDDDPETTPVFVNGDLSRMALDGNDLYVLDAGFVSGVIKVDVSGQSSEGTRETFSTAVTFDSEGERCVPTTEVFCPGEFNPFVEPIALAIGEPAVGDKRLLVLDNGLGSVVEVDIANMETLGQRNYLFGGRVLSGSSSLPASGEDDIVEVFSSAHRPLVIGLANTRLRDAILGTDGSVISILPDENALASFPLLGTSVVTRRTQAATLDEDDETIILPVTWETTFFDPRIIQRDISAGHYYVMDVATNRLLAIPASNLQAEREVASSASNAVLASDPIDSALIIRSVDVDPEPETRLFILDRATNDLVRFDLDVVYEEFDDEGNYSADPDADWFRSDAEIDINANRTSLAFSACFATPRAVLHYPYDPDSETIGDEQDFLLVVNADGSVSLIDVEANSCNSLALAPPLAGVDIIDAAFDARLDTDAANPAPTLMLLDALGKSVWQLSISLDVASPAASTLSPLVRMSEPASANGENQIASPSKIFFSNITSEAFIWDDIIKSFYIADLAPRDMATGQIVDGGSVFGRRLVGFRSAAMNCNPELDTSSTLSADDCRLERPE